MKFRQVSPSEDVRARGDFSDYHLHSLPHFHVALHYKACLPSPSAGHSSNCTFLHLISEWLSFLQVPELSKVNFFILQNIIPFVYAP